MLVEFGKNMRVPRVGFLRVLSARARLQGDAISYIHNLHYSNTKYMRGGWSPEAARLRSAGS